MRAPLLKSPLWEGREDRLRDAVRSVDRGTPISAVQTMRSVVDAATGEQRFYLVLLGAFAAIAVVLRRSGSMA